MNLATSYAGQGNGGEENQDLTNLVVRGYSPIGSVSGMGYGSAAIEAREGVIPGRQIATQSVRVEVSTGGDYPQVGVAAISFDNVEKLMSVLDRLQFTTISTDRYKFTEIEFEVDGFKIIVFNNERGGLMFALSAESASIHFNGLTKLSELKGLFDAAKRHLVKTKIC